MNDGWGKTLGVAVVGVTVGYLAYRLYFQAEKQNATIGTEKKVKRKGKQNNKAVPSPVKKTATAAPPSSSGGGGGGEETSSNPLDNVVLRPTSDTRLYRIITLTNGLRACLISDPSPSVDDDGVGGMDEDGASDADDGESSDDDDEEEEGDEQSSQKPAAAAFCMGVGSFEDTVELQGMAHFVEHMLFMGSERYPEEDQFDKFVAKHGGYSNAHTDMEETCFVFDVKKKHLRQTLDMFAQFFIAPLIQESSMNREVEAVDSEFTMNEQHDGVRKSQVFAALARQGHPASNFTWGNTLSLKETPEANKIPVRDRLCHFWKKNYSASRATVCVLGNETLDELEEMVTQIFEPLKTDGEPRLSYAHLAPPVKPEIFHQVVTIEPVKDKHELEITWLLPDMFDTYKKKPLSYLSELMGHEGSGSVCALLQKRGWSTSLCAGTSGQGSECNSNYFLFQCTVSLTDEGLANVKDVTVIIFQYLEMLRREGPQKRLWDEFAAVARASFRFMEEVEAIEHCETIAIEMQHYADEDVLRSDYVYSEWDPKAIADTLNYLLPSKAMLCISSKTLASKCKTTEPWFKTKYNVEPVDPAWESEFSKIGTKTSQIPKELHLPPPNVLIATDFALLPAPSVEPTAPALIDQQLTHAVWHQPDATFRTPRCNVYTKFVSPKIFESPEATVLYDLFISVLTMNLKEYAYAARLAELDYTFWAQRGGFCLRVHGFNEKLPTLLSIILKMIKEFDVDSQKLKMAQQQLVRKLQNNKLSPTNVARGLRLQLLDRKQWDEAELAKLVPQMTVEQLHSYVAVLPKGIYAKMLVHGNLSADVAQQLGNSIKTILETVPLLPTMHPVTRVTEVEPGSRVLRVANTNADDNNSCLEVYYQFGGNALREIVLTDLLQDIMSEPCFNELRTHQQLAYSVSCSTRMSYGHLGFMFHIQPQSSKFTVAEVDRRIESFLAWFAGYLDELPEEDFANHVEAAITNKLRPESNLIERSSAFFEEITSHAYCFERRQQEALVLMSTPKTDLKAELTAWFMAGLHPASPTRRKLAVWVVGSGEQTLPKAASSAGEEPEPDSDNADEQEEEGEAGVVDAGSGNTTIPDFADYITPTPVTSINVYRQQMSLLPCPFDVLRNIKLTSTEKEGEEDVKIQKIKR